MFNIVKDTMSRNYEIDYFSLNCFFRFLFLYFRKLKIWRIFRPRKFVSYLHFLWESSLFERLSLSTLSKMGKLKYTNSVLFDFGYLHDISKLIPSQVSDIRQFYVKTWGVINLLGDGHQVMYPIGTYKLRFFVIFNKIPAAAEIWAVAYCRPLILFHLLSMCYTASIF